jgi:hypothetical protein
MAPQTPAEIQFNTSSAYKLPAQFKGKAWKIKNDYPRSSDVAPSEDKPWLEVDFKTEGGAREYCNLVKEYFFHGNTEKNFIVQDNKVISPE